MLALPLLFIVFLQLWQLYLSNTAYERIEKEQIKTVIVESHRVMWKEEGREVTIDGEYFDLIAWSLNEEKYTFTGVFDKEETAIVNMLEKQSSNGISISRLMIFFSVFSSYWIFFYQISQDIANSFKTHYLLF